MREIAKAPAGNRLRRTIVLTTLAALAFFGIAAPQASAVSYFHPFLSAFGKQGTSTSKFDKVDALAVDPATHDLYVSDAVGRSTGDTRIYRFTESGAPSNFTEGPSAGTNVILGLTAGNDGNQLAVAPPGAPGGTAGSLYVSTGPSSLSNYPGSVDVYSPQGVHLGSLDGSGNPNPDSGGTPLGVAVDSTGNVYVARCKGFGTQVPCEGHIDKYVPSGNPVTEADFDSELRGFTYPESPPSNGVPVFELAAGESDLLVREKLYDLSLFPGGKGSADIAGKGASFGNWDGEEPSRNEIPYVDPASGDFYLAVNSDNIASPPIRVRRYDKDGNPIGSIQVPEGAFGVAVDGTSGKVYVSSRKGNVGPNSQVRIYGPGIPVEPPTSSIDPVADFDFQSASFSGTVNSGGSGEHQASTYRFVCTPECPGLQGERSIPADGNDHVVSDTTTGLKPEKNYEVTLIAKNATGEVKDTVTFETEPEPGADPPEVTIDPITSFTETTADLSGTVNPKGTEEISRTKYHFEYTPAEDYFTVDEQQQLTISATSGTFTATSNGLGGLTHGVGNLSEGSTLITNVEEKDGEFAVGQTISADGIPTGATIEAIGSGTLTISEAATENVVKAPLTGDWRTVPLAFNATAGQLQSALEALPTIDPGVLSVSGGPGDATGSTPYTISFEGAFGDRNVPSMNVEGNKLNEGASVKHSTLVEGRALFDEALSSIPGEVDPGESPVAVQSTINGLQPNTTYYVRLVAENFGGEAASAAPDPSVTTLTTAPLAQATGATSVRATAAQINARINPRNSQTTYYFQWGTKDCAFNPCTSTPLTEDGDAGSGGDFVYVNAQLEGLSPQTSYSYRLIAENEAGETISSSVAFETEALEGPCANQALRSGASARLSDCRAYEMVSPFDKNGGDVVPNPARSRAAANGNAVSYASLTAFADAVGINEVGTEYVSRRGSDGWSTHGITPQHLAPPIPQVTGGPLFMGEFSPDLSQGIFFGLTPIPGVTSANVAGVSNIYLGSGLGAPSPSMTLTSDSVDLLPPDREGFSTGYKPKIELAGHSDDFSHVIFETPYNLTSDATGNGVKLYEWVDGTVRLAGILPDSACGAPPCPAPASIAGTGALEGVVGILSAPEPAYTEPTGTISDDGSRIFFTAGALSRASDVSRLEGDLYLREDGMTTVQIDAGERSKPVPGGISQFSWATPDGDKAFFLSTKSLLDEDTDGVGRDLYEYDLTEPTGSRLTLLTPDHLTPGPLDVTDVVGVSEDGEFVYLLGPVIDDLGQRRQDMYLLHDGMVRLAGVRGGTSGGKGSLTNWGDFGAGFGGSMLRVSPDGRHVLFQSVDDQGLGYDNHGEGCELGAGWENERAGLDRCAELFLYSYASDEVVCVSCNPSGAPPAGNASFDTRQIHSLGGGQNLSQPLSIDGRRVFFNSRDALVSEDSNGKVDIYQYDVEAGKLSLISSGQCNCDSLFLSASPSGNDVFFATNEQLVARDIDNLYDVYDARVGGGIAFQNELSPAGCEGDACQAPPSVPSTQTPSSSGFTGPGNPQARPNKQKKKKRQQAKRRKQAKKKQNAKRAKKARRAQRQGRARR